MTDKTAKTHRAYCAGCRRHRVVQAVRIEAPLRFRAYAATVVAYYCADCREKCLTQ